MREEEGNITERAVIKRCEITNVHLTALKISRDQRTRSRIFGRAGVMAGGMVGVVLANPDRKL